MPTRARSTPDTDAARLRQQIGQTGLSQLAGDGELGIAPSTLYRYLAGEIAVPTVVHLAMCWLLVRDHVAGYVREREADGG